MFQLAKSEIEISNWITLIPRDSYPTASYFPFKPQDKEQTQSYCPGEGARKNTCLFRHQDVLHAAYINKTQWQLAEACGILALMPTEDSFHLLSSRDDSCN